MSIIRNICFLILLPIILFGQQQNYENKAFRTDENQKKTSYKKIDGNPYLFKDWVKADLIHLDQEKIEDAFIRLDLHQENLEVKDYGSVFVDENIMEIGDDKFIVLTDKYYKKITIAKSDNPKVLKDSDVDSLFLMKGIHKDYIDKYAIVLYDGKTIKLIKEIDIQLRESKVNSPGTVWTEKKFIRKKSYALIIEKEKKQIKLKEKDLYKVLGNKEELKKYIKANKLKVKKEPAAVQLLAYWESLK